MHETEQSTPAFQLPGPAILAGVAAITVLGLLVRLYGLTSYGLWFDEAYHIELVRLPSIGAMLDAVLSNPPSDPLYVLVLRPWVELFGAQAGSVRALSVVLSTATIPASFLLGRYALGTGAGMWGALFFALSPYGVELGQEAALYSLAALLTTLALAAGWRWLRTGKGLWLYVPAGVVAIYSHYVVAVILLIFGALLLFLFGRFKRERGRWVLANGLVVLAWVPWLVALIVHWLTSELARASLPHLATLEEVGGALVQFSGGTATLHQGPRWLWFAGLAAGALLLVVGWVAGPRLLRKSIGVMLALFVTIFVLPALVSASTGMWLFVPHFMLFLLPTLFVCMGCAAYGMRLTRLTVVNTLVLIALVVWLAVQSWGIVQYNRYPPHGADGLRELAAGITDDIRAGEPVFVTPPALAPTLKQYYEGELIGLPEEFDLRRVYLPYDAVDWHDRALNVIMSRLEQGNPKRLWLVYRPELDDGGQLLSDVRLRYRQTGEAHYQFADLYVFVIQP